METTTRMTADGPVCAFCSARPDDWHRRWCPIAYQYTIHWPRLLAGLALMVAVVLYVRWAG